MYGGIGAIMGAVGQTFAIAGLQRWVSFSAGLALLLGLFFAARCKFNASAWRFVTCLKTAFAGLVRRRTYPSIFCLGVVNGLLPCGLVYAAAAGAAATASARLGFLVMTIFGVATLPMLLGIGLAGRNLQLWLGPRAGKLIPASIVFVAALLILRSLALGIPFISPDLSAACPTCHYK
jgi:sulfite exporter TauE/SafE